MKCNNCGATLERTATFCGYCGTAVSSAPKRSNVIQDSSLGAAALAAAGAAGTVSVVESAPTGIDDLPDYYRSVFAAIDAGGSGASKWNWASALLGALWYFYRGLWAKGVLLVALSLSTGGVANLLLLFYMGKLGNYDLWLLRRQGKQMW